MTAEVPQEFPDEADTSGPSTSQEPAMLSPGTRLCRYEIDELIGESEIPARVFRVRLDGRREIWKTIMPADPLGAVAIHRLLITPDARAYAYSLERQLSELYVVSGIETRRAFPDRFRDWIAHLFGRGNSAGLALL